MGCFATCFPKSKGRKSLKPSPNTTTPCLVQLRDDEYLEFLQFKLIIEPKRNVNPIDKLPIKEDEKREKLNISGRKKVTFDLNLKIYEPLPDEDEIQDEIEKEEATERHSDSSSSSSLFSFPINSYRYQDCKDSDDEFEQLVSDDESDYEDCEDDDEDYFNEESSESLFALSIDSRKHKPFPSVTNNDKEEVNSPAPVKMNNLESVLQPVENKEQWKAIKARGKSASQKPQFHQEIAVDTSLSTWLL